MKVLRLKSGLSYRGMGLSFKIGVPVPVEDDEKARHLIDTGRFDFEEMNEVNTDTGTVLGDLDTGTAGDDPDFEADGEGNVLTKNELSAMDKRSIARYAAEHGIDLAGCKTREDMYYRVLEAVDPDNSAETQHGDGDGDAETDLDALQ